MEVIYNFSFPCCLLLVSSFFLADCDTVTLHALGTTIPYCTNLEVKKRFPGKIALVLT
jgi:hypothetical protein